MGDFAVSLLKVKFNSSKNIIIISFSLLVMIPTLLLSLIPYVISSKYLKNNIIVNTKEIVNKINISMEKKANKMEYYINNLSTSPTLQKIIKSSDFNKYNYSLKSKYSQIDDYICNLFLEDTPLINILFITEKKGFYHFNKQLYDNEYELKKNAWYNDTLRLNGKINWIGTKEKTDYLLNNNYEFITTKKILDSKSFDFIGVIYLSYSLPYYESILPTTDNNETIYIINSNGDVLLTTDLSLKPPELTSEEYKFLNSRDSGKFEKRIDNDNYIFVYSLPNKYGWKTLKKIPLDHLMGDLYNIRVSTTVLLTSCLILFLFFILYMYKRISRPLQRMITLLNGLKNDPEINTKLEKNFCYELIKLKSDIVKMAYENKETTEKLIDSETTKKKMELQKLQAQINPHFLYNTLTSIKFIAMLNNQKKISNLITSLIKLLKHSINREGLYITVGNELDNLNNYIYIESIIYEEKIEFIFETDDSLNNILIPNFILQPLVEDCIFHGIDPNSNQGIIKILNYMSDDTIVFKISDNGVGMTQSQIDLLLSRNENDKNSFSNLGIKSVNDKIKLLCGSEYGIDIISVVDVGTTFVIKLPT